MDNLKLLLSEKMKEIRTGKLLNLDQAAEATGISKAMLSQIERGQSMPTITTLWKIATGYRVPLTYFLEQEKSRCEIIDILNTEPLYEENRAMRTYTLLPYNPAQNLEMLYIEFDSGCVHESSGHMKGVEEYLFVQSGALELQLCQERFTVSETQGFRFQADIPHSYTCTSPDKCRILNTIFYPAAMPPLS